MPVLYLSIDTKNMKTELHKIVGEVDKVGDGLENVGKSAEKASSSVGGLSKSIAKAATAMTGLVAAFASVKTIETFAKRGVEFNSSMEKSRIGIASLITSMVDLEDAQGKALQGAEKYQAAQGVAADMMKEIQQLGLETTATSEELVAGVQSVMGPALQAGMALKDIPKFAVNAAQAMQTLGVPLNQMRTELDALLTGRINMAQDILAPKLFADKGGAEEIRAYINELKAAGTLQDEIMRRLEPFALAGKDVANTWEGLLSNLEEAIDVVAGNASETLTGKLKESLKAVQGIFVQEVEQGGKTTVAISKDFENILRVVTEIENIIGDNILSAVQSLADMVKKLNSALGDVNVSDSFDKFADIIKNVAIAYGTARVARTLFTKSQQEGAQADGAVSTAMRNIMSLLPGYGTELAQNAQAKLQNAKASLEQAKAEAKNAEAIIASLQTKRQSALLDVQKAEANLRGATTSSQLERAQTRLANVERSLASATESLTQARNRQNAAAISVEKATLSSMSAMTGLTGAFKGLLAMVGGPVGLAFTAATMGITALASAESESTKYAREHADAMRASSADMLDATYAANQYTEKLKAMSQAQREFEATLATQALNKLKNDIGGVEGKLQELAEYMIGLELPGFDLVGQSMDNLTNATSEQLKVFRDQIMSAQAASGAVSEYDKNLNTLLDTLIAATQRQEQATQAVKDGAEANKQGAKSANDYAENKKLLAQINEALKESEGENVTGLEAMTKATEKILKATKDSKQELEEYNEKLIDSTILEWEKAEVSARSAQERLEASWEARAATAEEIAQWNELSGAIANAKAQIDNLKGKKTEWLAGRNDRINGKSGGSGGASKVESAKDSIRKLREEIAQMNGTSNKVVADLNNKLKEIAKSGKDAKMSMSEINKLTKEYEAAFKNQTVKDFNKTILELEGNTKELQKLNLQQTLDEWKQRFKAAHIEGEELTQKMNRLEEAMSRKTRMTNLQNAVSFLKDMRSLGQNVNLTQEKLNELIHLQGLALVEGNDELKQYLEQWEQLQRLAQDDTLYGGMKRGLLSVGQEMGDLGKQMEGVVTQMAGTISSQLTDAFLQGKFSAEDFFNSVSQMFVRLAAQAAMNAVVGKMFGAVGSMLPFATGGVVGGSGISEYRNTVVTTPTFFADSRKVSAYATGTGLMGEAGPEAIMPLTRMSDGNLGVQMDMGEYGKVEKFDVDGFARALSNYGGAGKQDVTVNVINQTGRDVQADTQASIGPNGGLNLDVIITQIEQGMVSKAKSGRSNFVGYMEKSYGLSRAGVLTRSRR